MSNISAPCPSRDLPPWRRASRCLIYRRRYECAVAQRAIEGANLSPEERPVCTCETCELYTRAGTKEELGLVERRLYEQWSQELSRCPRKPSASVHELYSLGRSACYILSLWTGFDLDGGRTVWMLSLIHI